MALADKGDELFGQLIGFVPEHVVIKGYIVADYLKPTPRVLKVEAEGGRVASRYFGNLLSEFTRKEIDEKKLHGMAGGPGLVVKLSKNGRVAEFMLVSSALSISTARPVRAFDLLADNKGLTFVTKLTDSLMLHQQSRPKIWTSVLTKSAE